MRRTLTLGLALVLVALGQVPAQAEDGDLSLGFGPGRVFSPNGDDQDDVLGVDVCTTTAAQVSVVVRNAGGTPVWSPAAVAATPDECGGVEWDGATPGGSPAPDGDYQLTATSVASAGGAVTTVQEQVTIDRRTPGTLTSPAAGAALTAETEIAFTPTAGFETAEVEFQVWAGEDDLVCSSTGTRQPTDGRWTGQLDPTDCAVGSQEITASVSWVDQYGDDHGYRTPGIEVVRADGAMTARLVGSPRTFDPAEDGALSVGYCVVDGAGAPSADVVLDVLDGDGAVVRSLADESVLPETACRPWYGSSHTAWWDGRDAAGEQLPDGDYTIRLRADNGTDPEVTHTFATGIDRLPPGELTSSAGDGPVVADTVLTLAPRTGITFDDVRFLLRNDTDSCTLTGTTAEGGSWTATPTAACGTGPWRARASASWMDRLGGWHEWWSAPVGVQPGITLNPTTRQFSPNDDDSDDTTGLGFCVVTPAGADEVQVRADVVTAGGALVATTYDELQPGHSPSDVWNGACSWTDWDGQTSEGAPAADGSYAWRLTVTGGAEPMTATSEILLDRRTPARVLAPAAGATLTADTPVVVEAAEGFEVTGVEVEFADVVTSDACRRTAELVEGAWRATAGAECGADFLTARAVVTWRDAFGDEHEWQSRRLGRIELVTLSGDRFISPGGDGFDDSLTPVWCVLSPEPSVHVTARIRNAADDVVATLYDDDRAPDDLDAAWYGECEGVAWSGEDTAGAEVPDGEYVLEVIAQAPGGQPFSSRHAIDVERAAPGAVSLSSADGTVTGDTVITFTPSAAVGGIEEVDFELRPFGDATEWCNVRALPADDASGAWSAQPGDCGAGPWIVRATVQWKDRFGSWHWFTSGAAGVADGITLSGPQVSVMGGSSHLETTIQRWCVVDASVDAPIEVVAEVLDAAGDRVRLLSDETRFPDRPEDIPWFCSQASWDGRDDDAENLPSGRYRLQVTASLDGSIRHEADRELVIDRRIPGVLKQPVTVDATHVKTGVVVGDGVDVTGVEFIANDGDTERKVDGILDASAGAWRVTMDVAGMAGAGWVGARVRWRDELGGEHTYGTTNYAYRFGTEPRISLHASERISPNGDGFSDQLDVQACVDVVRTDAGLPVRVEVRDSGGEVVRVLHDAPIGLSGGANDAAWYGCSTQVTWDGTDAEGVVQPAGDYRLVGEVRREGVVVATDSRTVSLVLHEGGEILEPEVDSIHTGLVTVAFRPFPGVAPVLVNAYGCGSGWDPVREADPDGVWRMSVDVSNCSFGNERVPLDISVAWPRDGSPSNLAYESATRYVRVPRAPRVDSAYVTAPNFSPNGDGTDDTLGIGACAVDTADGGPLTGVVRIRDEAEALVRAFDIPEVDLRTSGTCDPWYGAITPRATWDGLDDTGAAAPDGTYTIEFTATDRTGLSDAASTSVVLDRREPGTVVEPAADASVSGAVQLGFRPTEGFDIRSVRFVVSPAVGEACSSGYASSADLDGVWRAPLDTIGAQCGDGPRKVRADVQWYDALGTWRHALSRPVDITLANPAAAPVVVFTSLSPRVFSPNGDDVDDVARIGYCVRDATGGGSAQVTTQVVDSSDAVVRTLVSAPRPPGSGNCFTDYLSWDGRNDAGDPVPEGQYRVKVQAVDPGGLTGGATSVTLIVDRRPPGTVTTPADGAALGDSQEFVFTPTEGINVTHVAIALAVPGSEYWEDTCSGSATRDGSGLWRTTIDITTCGTGRRVVVPRVSWTDSLGSGRYYSTPTISVDLGDTSPRIVAEDREGWVILPRAEGYGDSALSTRYCVEDAPDAGPVHVTATLRDAAGDLVDRLQDASVTPSARCLEAWYGSGDQQYLYWDGTDDLGIPVGSGDYQLTIRATDAAGGVDQVERTVVVDRRVPGRSTAPQPGDLLAGTADLAFTPTDGFELDEVRATVNTSGSWLNVAVNAPAEDGTWRAQVPVGQLVSGAGTVQWQASWTDRFGFAHTYYAPAVPVTVDTATLPLSVQCDCFWIGNSKRGVYDGSPAEIDLRTSEAFGDAVALSVNWGDGSAAEQVSVAAPYDVRRLAHTYAGPGNYTVTVQALSPRGATATKSIPVTVVEDTEPPEPNTPPSVSVSTTPLTGTAPLDTTTTIQASDPDGDPLSYTINFGDGSPVVSGSLPVAPVAHRYANGGSFAVRVAISDGKAAPVIRFASVSVALDEPLVAQAGDDLVVPVGVPVTLDGSASRPALGITRASWHYGDGASEDGLVRTHTYSQPGTYQARLTAWAGQASDQDEATITVTAPDTEPGLRVTVRTADNTLVADADVLVQLADGARVQAVTDTTGTAVLHGLPDGFQTVYVAKAGYLPATTSAQVSSGEGEAVVQLKVGEVASATLESKPLTRDEIIEAGIDPDAPENKNVVEFSVHLAVDSGGFTVSGYTSSGGGTGGWSFPRCPSIDGQNVTCTDEQFCNDLTSGYVACARPSLAGDKPQLVWMVVPSKASWLKEFFRVTMVVNNLATDSANVLDHGQATLALPSGLALASLSGGAQSLTRTVPDIPALGDASVAWIVRGDAEGDYSLSASYSGTLQPTGTPITVEARTKEPLHVWGKSALRIEVDADDVAYGQWDEPESPFEEDLGAFPFHATVRLRNVADVPVYNVALQLSDAGRENFAFAPDQVLSISDSELAPGEVLTRDLILVPTTSGTIELEQSFASSASGATLTDAIVTEHPRAVPKQDVPEFQLLRGSGDRALVVYDEVPGATSYRFFSIDGTTGSWRRLADPTGVALPPGASGYRRGVLTGIDPERDRYLVITSVVSGKAQMVHQLRPLPSTASKPSSALDWQTGAGGPHGCYTHVPGGVDVNDPWVDVHTTFSDPFGVDSWAVLVDGVEKFAGDGEGRALMNGMTFRIDFPDTSATRTVVFRATNMAGDTAEETVEVDLDCPVEKAVVVAMGLNSSLDNTLPTVPVTSPNCANHERGDAFLTQAATNACDNGAANTDADGNLIAWLTKQGFDAGESKSSPNRTLLEFSYYASLTVASEAAEVDCFQAGGPRFVPTSYGKERTYRELVKDVGLKRNPTADKYLDALVEYDDCWRRVNGKQLSFTVIGHSLGGYETLALAESARESGRQSMFNGFVTIDGAIQPEYILANTLGTCLSEDVIKAAGINIAWLGSGTAGNLAFANWATGPNWSSDVITATQQAGIPVATLTNRHDNCLPAAATLNHNAAISRMYDVDNGGGQAGHGAILTAHDPPVYDSGYPILANLEAMLEGRVCRVGSGGGAGSWTVQGQPCGSTTTRSGTAGARRTAGAEGEAPPVLTGRAVRSAGGPVTYGQAVAIGGGKAWRTSIGSNGDFAFADLPAGDYRVVVHPGSGAASQWIGGADQASATTFAVGGAPVVTPDVVVAVNRTVDVVAKGPAGQPLASAAVVAVGADDHPVAWARTSPTGAAQLVVPPGNWRILAASVDGYVGEVSLAEAVSTGTVSAAAVPATRVKVTDTSGNPLADVFTQLTHGGQTWLGQTNELGEFTFLGVPAGTATLTVQDLHERLPTTDAITTPVEVVTGDPADNQVQVKGDTVVLPDPDPEPQPTCGGKIATIVATGTTVAGTSGADVIVGTAGNDVINAGGGADVICGLGGNDTVTGAAGNDVIDGGPGTDTVSFATASTAVVIDFVTRKATGKGTGADTLTSVEGAIGSKYGDTFVSSRVAERIDGRAGGDTVSYAKVTARVVVRLDQRKATGAGGSDVLVSLENAIGTRAGDALTGTSGTNTLTGGAGNDVLSALGGNDRLIGGTGRDTCVGGTGRDTAVTCEVRRTIP